MMLCKTNPKHNYEDDNWIYQLKFDGIRANWKEGELYNRRGKCISFLFPEIIEEMENLGVDMFFDGEIVVPYHDFNDGIAKRIHLKNEKDIEERSKMLPAQFVAFDVLEFNGGDIRFKPLKERLSFLSKISAGDCFAVAECFGDGLTLLANTKEVGGEGIVAKHLNSSYSDCRSNHWIKIKNWNEMDIVAVKYDTNPKGITIETAEGIRCAVNGKQHEVVKEKIDACGKALVEIQYLEKTKLGKPRFPSYNKLKGGL
jgi:ATP-dependent DNA ligase